MRFFTYLVLGLIGATILQNALPIFSLWGLEIHIYILPVFFLCLVVTQQLPGMLLFAYLTGFLWDARNTLLVQSGDPQIYTQPVEMLRFGHSIIIFALMGLFMLGTKGLHKTKSWEQVYLLQAIAIFVYLFLEYFLMSFVRGSWNMNTSLITQMAVSSLFGCLISPLIFLLLRGLSGACHHEINDLGWLKKRSKARAR